MDAAVACMKYILFTMNFIIWCLGGAIAGVGIWVRSDRDFWEYHNRLPIAQYYQAAYVVIAVGVILLIIGFLGCCGAAVDSPCMLFTYIVMMSIIIILELAAAGLVWKEVNGDKFQDFLRDQILHQIELAKSDEVARRFLNMLEMHLECCGASNMKDYDQDAVPASCSSKRTNNVFIFGCAEHLRRYLEIKGGLIGGMILGIGLIQIMSLVFTTCLFCALREEAKEFI